MTCCHNGYHLARSGRPECELPTCQRNDVYVFAISSLNPISVVALDGLREQLNRQGFAKVATGQTIHAGWMAREMRRIHEAEPDAISSSSASSRAAPRRSPWPISGREGVPVGGVVVIATEASAPTSRHGSARARPGQVEDLRQASAESVPNVATYGLATEHAPVEAVGNLLKDVATRAGPGR